MTNTQAGALLMKTPQWIRTLHKDGWIAGTKVDGEYRYRLLDVVQGYVRFKEDADRRASRVAASSRISDARAREVELRNRVREGQLIETDGAVELIEGLVGRLRSHLAGVAARATRDLQLRRVIEAAINDGLDAASSDFEKWASDLEAGLAAHKDLPADGSGHVGSGKPDASAVGGSAGTA